MSPAPASSRPSPGRPLYPLLWGLVAVPLTVVGVLLSCLTLTLPVTAGVMVCAGAGGALVCWLVVDDLAPRRVPADRGRLQRWALVATVATLAVCGLSTLGPSGALFAILLVATCPPAVSHVLPGAAGGVAPPPPVEPASAGAGLPDPAGLSTDALCQAWTASFDAVTAATAARDPRAAAHLAELRRTYLEELERRDAVGFTRWIVEARPGGDPRRYIGSRPAGETEHPPAA